ncbi:MAG: anthranilate synthase component I family protein [Verrucomicrobiae bacterium]|nr:anthranilate synthase component I family protein [Verrucomicrobiae bacterium]
MDPSSLQRANSAFGLRSRDLSLSPVEVARGLSHLPGLVFLDSSVAENEAFRRDARFSLVAAEPVERVSGDFFSGADRERLRRALDRYRSGDGPALDLGFPAGGAIGAIAYDGGFQFGLYPEVLIYDHRRESWLECGRLSERLREPGSFSDSIPAETLSFATGTSRESFLDSVRRAQEYIAAGDIYQVNLSHRFRALLPNATDAQAFSLYESLRESSPAPFAAFLDLGGGRRVLSSSPELFLEISGNAIRTRPIKGTRPRFRDPARDEKSAYDLLTSPKEIAELIMITDLERNDLGQICEYGSVQATDLLKLERYAQVFHLVSTVEGRLRPGIDHVEALAACFPGGSITGAPKKRAREIIDELESEPRGLYTGTIGMFGFDGESRFNIAIRTAIIENDEIHFHTGAGIVADSVPEAEYEETLHKAAGILNACETSPTQWESQA